VDGGYSPARVEVREGEPVRLQFLRRDASSCTRVVTFPKLNIRQELPERARTDIVLPPLAAGTFEFGCAMGMIRGTLVVSPRA
jgi:plastocyanin domain-containing protein